MMPVIQFRKSDFAGPIARVYDFLIASRWGNGHVEVRALDQLAHPMQTEENTLRRTSRTITTAPSQPPGREQEHDELDCKPEFHPRR